jgi:hypothetical protein
MLIFNRASTVQSLVPLSTLIVGVSFIFANSAKTLFESLIFIFSTHPYDVGDLVLVSLFLLCFLSGFWIKPDVLSRSFPRSTPTTSSSKSECLHAHRLLSRATPRLS